MVKGTQRPHAAQSCDREVLWACDPGGEALCDSASRVTSMLHGGQLQLYGYVALSMRLCMMQSLGWAVLHDREPYAMAALWACGADGGAF